MMRSLSLNLRFAAYATLAFCIFAYEAIRTTVAASHESFGWVPQTTAPPWARIGFHAVIAATAVALCAACAYRAVVSMQLHITPNLSVATARNSTAEPRLARLLPATPDNRFTVQLNRLGDQRWWTMGAGLFLVTALPYWVLLAFVGHVAAVGPLYLALRIGRHLPAPVGAALVAAGVLGLMALRLLRRRQRRISAADKPAMAIIAFIAGAETWTSRQQWRACALYSLWLQKRGILPFLTLLTAIPSQRLLMAIYCRQLKAGWSHDDALSHVFTIRVARLVTALAFYAAFVAVKLWPYVH